MLRHVDLCSGIGGFSLGFEWAELSKPVLFCDIEPWSRQILAKHWPDVPIAEDVKELANDPDGLVPDCDIITAGYPCQSFSLAGKRRGTEDDRHIWPYIFSIVQKKRCSWCVFENVLGHVTLGLDEVLSDLEREGYATRPFVVPACATDAPHRRDRLWIVARNVGNSNNKRVRPRIRRASSKSIEESSERKDHNEGSRANGRFADAGKPQNLQEDVADTISARGETWASNTVGNGDGSRSNKKQPKSSSSKANVADTQSKCRNERFDAKREKTSQQKGLQTQIGTSSSNVADAQSKRVQRHWAGGQQKPQSYAREKVPLCSSERPRATTWKPEPRMGRVAHGVSNRVDRLRGLGNAIVPQIAMRIGQTIKATYNA